MSKMNSNDNPWSLQINPTGNGTTTKILRLSTSDTYTSNNQPAYIDRDIKISVYCNAASLYADASNSRQVQTAGWYGRQSGSNSGTISNWTLSKNVLDLKYNGNYAYITFKTAKTFVPANTSLTISLTSSLNKNYSNPSGYIPIYGTNNTTVMCPARNDGAGPSAANITSRIKDNGTWTVGESNGSYVYARQGSTNYDIGVGNNFSYDTYSDSYTSGGYYSGTPGSGIVWHPGTTTYFTAHRLKVNGTTIWDSSSSISIFCYSPSTSITTCYIYK